MSAPNTKNNDGAGGGGGDADSFSSDSDDEFLTIREDGKGNVDREALVRKKLLESFYGKAAVQEDNNDDSSDDDSSSSGRKPPSRSASHDTYDDGSDEENTKKRRSRKVDPIAAADLDSADFDATKHTEAYVLHSGVHPLLETEESLACQVRTLDSSMQTLVYENYSRFIEATDAIRSIGVNVQANSSNLQKLSTSMETVGETARRVESSCGALRDSVVEKLRVKRLLQRLDALLKLPSTLRENIDAGRYRWASKSYLTAYNILSKHSAGFESLQRIEIECYDIMESLLVDVRRKLLHWSGKLILDDDDDLDGDDDCEDDQGENLRTKQSALLEDPPDPPQSVAEIFECAGTAVLMLMNQRQKQEDGITDSIATTEVLDRPATITRMASRVEFDPGLTLEECKDMALSACLRLLERHLDTHHIELQDAMFATDGATGLGASGKSNGLLDTAQLAVPSLQSTQTPLDANVARGTSLVPTKVLESILEAATLYSITFHSEHVENSQKLSRFVSTAFETFLQNVRSELLEQLLQASPKDWKHEMGGSTHEAEVGVDTKATEGVGEDQIESDEKAYEHITSATSLLVESVRQLASGLSLPEVAIDLDLASGLVDQAVGLSEAMVRKRVDQKFFNLRYRVIENCLAPFCLKVLKGPDGNEEKNDDGVDGIPVSKAIQMASVALSDSLQLVDDTIRSVLSRTNTIDPQESSSSLASVEDASMLKMAVEQSSNRFCIWLAAALETLAGCESTKPGHIVDIKPDDANGDRAASYYSGFSASRETLGDDENELAESIEECMVELLDELDQYKMPSSRSNFALAVVVPIGTVVGLR
jgi:vacuolar protein sorting-associated protein 51